MARHMRSITQGRDAGPLGKKLAPHPRPWLQGRDQDKEAMDAEVTQTRERWRATRQTDGQETDEGQQARQRAKSEFKRVTKDRRRQLRQLERLWWDDIAQLASAAA